MITNKSIQEVINAARVEDVIGDFMNLRRRGVNLIGNCPFHDEKTPSFTVSPTKNIYKCFGCGKGGDSVRFIMDHENLSFPEAIRFIASKYKIELEETEQTVQEKENKQISDSLYIVNEFAAKYYSDVLFNREEGKAIGLSYFKERGFREATITKFGLGYATDERDAFTKKAVEKKYNIDYLHTLGLTTKSDLDFFRSRVIFPIHNISGKIVAFAGRTLSADKKIPKYINSPESEIYNKRSVLYGLYFAKDSIRKEDECILVEGYTDVITLHQGNVQNVVASSGTSLTNDQIRLIKRYTPNIKIIYDGDPAGIKAALRGLDMVLESDMNVKLVLLPDGEDPDSFLAKNGTELFKTYLKENEQDFVFFKTKLLLKETGNDPIKKTLVLKDIVQSIAKIPDPIKRTLYVKECSTMMDVSESILINETNKIIKEDIRKKKMDSDRERMQQIPDESDWINEKPKPYPEGIQQELIQNDGFQEREIASILVNFGDKWYDEPSGVIVADFILEHIYELVEKFDIPLYKTILEESKKLRDQSLSVKADYFTQHTEETVRNFAIEALSTPYTYADWDKKFIILQTQKMPDENYQRQSYKAILRLKLRKAKKIIAEIKLTIDNATDDEKNSDDYLLNLKVLQEVVRQRNQLASELGTVTLT
ncbi:MAG: DNA primase [Saprospiraceae bacterium]|nr:DNA primase [Saprospiraceae bacterium]